MSLMLKKNNMKILEFIIWFYIFVFFCFQCNEKEVSIDSLGFLLSDKMDVMDKKSDFYDLR